MKYMQIISVRYTYLCVRMMLSLVHTHIFFFQIKIICLARTKRKRKNVSMEKEIRTTWKNYWNRRENVIVRLFAFVYYNSISVAFTLRFLITHLNITYLLFDSTPLHVFISNCFEYVEFRIYLSCLINLNISHCCLGLSRCAEPENGSL